MQMIRISAINKTFAFPEGATITLRTESPEEMPKRIEIVNQPKLYVTDTISAAGEHMHHVQFAKSEYDAFVCNVNEYVKGLQDCGYEVVPVSQDGTPAERRDKVNYYLDIAETVASRSTCLRRQYGAIIVKNDQIVATGYNGAPRGAVNCSDMGYCVRMANDVPHGERYEDCRALHAEMNAVISASRGDMLGGTLYLAGKEGNGYVKDASPCKMCRRVIVNAGIETVIVRNSKDEYTMFDVRDWLLGEKADLVPHSSDGTYVTFIEDHAVRDVQYAKSYMPDALDDAEWLDYSDGARIFLTIVSSDSEEHAKEISAKFAGTDPRNIGVIKIK